MRYEIGETRRRSDDERNHGRRPTCADAARRAAIFRHRLATRLWHWINAFTIFIMIGSGLGILNAHPHLYWGQYGANFDHRRGSICRTGPAG